MKRFLFSLTLAALLLTACAASETQKLTSLPVAPMEAPQAVAGNAAVATSSDSVSQVLQERIVI